MPDPTPPETLTSNQKISSGLAVSPSPQGGPRAPSFNPKLVFGSPADISAASATLESTTAKYVGVVNAISTQAENERNGLKMAFKSAGMSPGEVTERADKATDNFCKAKLKEGEAAFSEHAKTIDAILARTEASLEASSSPATMLAVVGLHEKERDAYNIASAKANAAGPAALSALSNHSIATLDKVLGAAIMDRLNSMTADERRTAKGHGVADIQTLAEVFCGKQWRARRLALLRIQHDCLNFKDVYAAQVAYVAGRRAEPKKTPHEMLESGLRQKAIERLAVQVAQESAAR